MPDYFRFRVQLLDAAPPIWREFLLRKTATFQDLHYAIQDACGWQDYHLFAFRNDERGPAIATIPNEDLDPPEPDAEDVKLSRRFGSGSGSCLYQYDFGDDWWHEVTLIEMVSEPRRFYRRILGGARAFPPEDCGGTPGYEECVALVSGMPLEYREPDELRQWLGDWHPERFDLDTTRMVFDMRTRPGGERFTWFDDE